MMGEDKTEYTKCDQQADCVNASSLALSLPTSLESTAAYMMSIQPLKVAWDWKNIVCH